MGLKFSGLVLDRFLYNGFNLAILQSLGKSPEEMGMLHIFARISAPSFKNFPEILSIPADFEMSINCKTSKNFFSIVKFRLKLCFYNIGKQNLYQICENLGEFGRFLSKDSAKVE